MVAFLAALTVAAATPVNATTVQQSRQSFERGQKAYKAGEYQAAIEAFLSADRLNPSPDLMYDVAQAYEKLGDLGSAINFYQAYVSRAPEARDVPAVRANIANLRAHLASGEPVVLVPTEPPPLAATPLATLEAQRPAPQPPPSSVTEVPPVVSATPASVFHPRPLAIACASVAVVAAAFAIAGAVDVANFQGTRSAVEKGYTVSYTSAQSQSNAATIWGGSAIVLTVVAAAGVTGAVLTW